ncbi:MAG TPA: hypothetical protein VKS22_05715 [Candidatus Binataceae bacterium]|nr:hypothetical protein [Candidatus Binataceae bacterium]
MSLALSLDRQARRDQARVMLAEIFTWFSAGSASADLKDTKALLNRLDSKP